MLRTSLQSGKCHHARIRSVRPATATQTLVGVTVTRTRLVDTTDQANASNVHRVRKRSKPDKPLTDFHRQCSSRTDPVTAAKQTATVEPAPKVRVLRVEALRSLLVERSKLTTDIELLPNRLATSARQLDTLTGRADSLTGRVQQEQAAVDRPTMRLEEHRSGGWLNRLKPGEVREHQQTLATVGPVLKRDVADLGDARRQLRGVRDEHARLRDFAERGPARFETIIQVLGEDAHGRLLRVFDRPDPMPDVLGALIEEQLGP